MFEFGFEKCFNFGWRGVAGGGGGICTCVCRGSWRLEMWDPSRARVPSDCDGLMWVLGPLQGQDVILTTEPALQLQPLVWMDSFRTLVESLMLKVLETN